jgi:hypothetical protein
MTTIDIWPGKNLWRAPDWHSCFGIQLVGPSPTGDKLLEMQAIVSNRRRAWSPDPQAWKQLQAVTNAIVRRHVLARIWDSIIVALAEAEAPFPIKAWCSAVETRTNEEGLLQAYLRLEHPQPVPNAFGRDESTRYLIPGGEDDRFWINLGALYAIEVLDE